VYGISETVMRIRLGIYISPRISLLDVHGRPHTAHLGVEYLVWSIYGVKCDKSLPRFPFSLLSAVYFYILIIRTTIYIWTHLRPPGQETRAGIYTLQVDNRHSTPQLYIYIYTWTKLCALALIRELKSFPHGVDISWAADFPPARPNRWAPNHSWSPFLSCGRARVVSLTYVCGRWLNQFQSIFSDSPNCFLFSSDIHKIEKRNGSSPPLCVCSPAIIYVPAHLCIYTGKWCFLNNAKVKHINTKRKKKNSTIPAERENKKKILILKKKKKNAHGYLYTYSVAILVYILLVLDLYASVEIYLFFFSFRYFCWSVPSQFRHVPPVYIRCGECVSTIFFFWGRDFRRMCVIFLCRNMKIQTEMRNQTSWGKGWAGWNI